MAITNAERVGKSLELLKGGLAPFVQREFEHRFKGKALEQAHGLVSSQGRTAKLGFSEWDAHVLLKLMWEAWHVVFRDILGHAERTLVSELRTARNRWAHQKPFSADDAYRTLDSVARLLTAVSAPEANEVEKMKMALLRVRFDEQMRSEKRKTAAAAVTTGVMASLKPWREVVNPHQDVASGRYQQAEFAADLWQVHLGEGAPEYRDPVEFFRRTYLTDSLGQLLTGAVRRMSGDGGDPVVQLQTNFGGGKTHSMLALYHLFSGVAPRELAGVEEILKGVGVSNLPPVNRVVLVGNKISPGNPVTKPDGTIVRTLWGEMAWQLGAAAGGPSEARKAFDRIAADDERATSPGDTIRSLMNEYGPCLILIDEWVAYARQLHDESDLPGGSFETHFTFAQALTESAKSAEACLLVISLPASDTSGSPHARADDVEVGGARGHAALNRLRNAVGRVEASWRPASTEEGFEIVRRRLFEPLVTREQFVARDRVAREFYDLYRTQHQEFPAECAEAEYERRLTVAYPIHPEVFDRLYEDWSTLIKFQRTRGVLRLMAAVIHSLWEKVDRNPLILPSSIPIDDPQVQFELTRYLSENWDPVIQTDVDGPNARPRRIDGDVPNLGKYAACRRVARTIYMGSAPTLTAAHRGIEDRRVNLGCVMPGESPAVFGDALRRLAASATYLYEEGARYWYSTQPTVTKLAEDRAAQLERDPDAVTQELERRLRKDLRRTGDFPRVHPCPASGRDIPDDLDARLIVLGWGHPYAKGGGSPAETISQAILESRGSSPRLFRNTMVFLAADQSRIQELDQALRRYLAWQSILADREVLDLSPQQVKQAETQQTSADSTVTARLPEAYQCLLVPVQEKPDGPVGWSAYRLTGHDALAVRASKKLSSQEELSPSFGGTMVKLYMDRVPLWRGNHVPIKQLHEDFARYHYLPRLTQPAVLDRAIEDALSLLSWQSETFAYADSFDEAAGRYRGIRCGQQIRIDAADTGLLVKAEVAQAQLEQEAPPPSPVPPVPPVDPSRPVPPVPPIDPPKVAPKRYHGTVELDPLRMGRDAGQIADEVVAHLAGLVGSTVRVTLEIDVRIPEGAPQHVVRTVTENGQTLRFTTHGFEEQ